MKKILCFLTGFCVCLGLGVVGFSAGDASAESSVIELNNANFAADIKNTENKNFVLTEDIVLQNWESVDAAGITLNGNGFSITTAAPLFQTISGGSTITNLAVIAAGDFQWQATDQTKNFGLLACNALGSTFSNVYVTCASAPDGTPNADLEKYGEMNIAALGSGVIGGMFGSVGEGTIIKDAYAKIKLEVTQTDENALSTIVGGFVGKVSGSTITNCFAVPMDADLVKATFATNIISSNAQILVGGFAGQIESGVVANVFAGGALPANQTLDAKTISAYRIAGSVAQTSVLKNAYTFNQNANLSLLAQGQAGASVAFLEQSTFTGLGDFVGAGHNNIWATTAEWDTVNVWCKKTETFPVLQTFQNFQITLNTAQNSQGVEIEILDELQNPIEEDGMPVTKVEQKYGTNIFLKVKITEDFAAYSKLSTLFCSNAVVKTFTTETTEALVPITVTGGTSGAYSATSENVTYKLKVLTDNKNQGNVYVKGAPVGIDPDRFFEVSYLGLQSFVATPSNNSYTFEKWVWVAEDGTETPALIGDPANEKLAAQTLTLKFGDENFTDNFVYLYMLNADEANVPFALVDGEKIFTLKAKFTTHNENLNIIVSSNLASVDVYVSSMLLMGVEELEGINFSCKVTVGMMVEVRLEVAEGYVFNGWSVKNQSFSSLVDTQNGEDEMSTTIHVTPNGELTLYADITKEEVKKVDLTWLWITLGGIGGAAIITLIVVVVVRRKRSENFLHYY
ncbi:MAG: hypothetical protein ACLRFR_03495 [Clostridia bacterium]